MLNKNMYSISMDKKKIGNSLPQSLKNNPYLSRKSPKFWFQFVLNYILKNNFKKGAFTAYVLEFAQKKNLYNLYNCTITIFKHSFKNL